MTTLQRELLTKGEQGEGGWFVEEKKLLSAGVGSEDVMGSLRMGLGTSQAKVFVWFSYWVRERD